MKAKTCQLCVLTRAKGTSGEPATTAVAFFLPTMYGGIPFRNAGDPVLYLSNPKGIDNQAQRESLDALKDLNALSYATIKIRKRRLVSTVTKWRIGCR